MPLTDEQLADRMVRSRVWKTYQRFNAVKHWNIDEVVCTYLQHFPWLVGQGPMIFYATVSRVATIIRKRNAKEAARTRSRQARMIKRMVYGKHRKAEEPTLF